MFDLSCGFTGSWTMTVGLPCAGDIFDSKLKGASLLDLSKYNAALSGDPRRW
jgi:hypothetical protein